MLENELDEKQRMGEMCQRLKDEVRGMYSCCNVLLLSLKNINKG